MRSSASSWQAALSQVLDGDELDDAASQMLTQALSVPKNLAEARGWMALESDLRSLGDGTRGFDLVLSKEKLLSQYPNPVGDERSVGKTSLIRSSIHTE